MVGARGSGISKPPANKQDDFANFLDEIKELDDLKFKENEPQPTKDGQEATTSDDKPSEEEVKEEAKKEEAAEIKDELKDEGEDAKQEAEAKEMKAEEEMKEEEEDEEQVKEEVKEEDVEMQDVNKQSPREFWGYSLPSASEPVEA
ncbi:hypothetical protein AK812_SmicGene33828 [Symbiodinium microadriaticum]|uniref:Uncharacterized protein n=1 Tax=Symbiodinium microadriaticum TaxID=2951 RepID=A0A1Q9CQJ0_SYMMI|nr:hypothetical protein AK812_SmicGene33828 [Symbiodinium microadriaticum]CAE7040401.1 unnamed protein product [Symbiodinium sp. KB8]